MSLLEEGQLRPGPLFSLVVAGRQVGHGPPGGSIPWRSPPSAAATPFQSFSRVRHAVLVLGAQVWDAPWVTITQPVVSRGQK